MSFHRTHRAQALRSDVCSSTNLAICDTFRRLGINPITYTEGITVPRSPNLVSFTFSGTSATISFTPGSNGGSEITSYQYSIDNGATYITPSPVITASPITISGLTIGTVYLFKLRAINVVGIGSESSALSVVIPIAPSAPTGLSYSTSGSSAIISFSAGSNGGSALTNYQYSTDGGSTFSAFSPVVTSSPVTITGLSNGSTYSVMLKAVNVIGNSPASSALSVVMPAGAPSAPSALSSSVSGTTATISFTAGANGGSAITNYQYSTDGGSTFSAFSPAVTTSPVTISGLSNGSTYSIILKAVNVAGNSPSSAALSVFVPAAAPSAPSALSSSVSGSTATISFTPGSNGGGAITNYQYSTDGGSTFSAFSPAVTASPVTITGLSNGSTYSVMLKAVNSAGVSPSSSAVSVSIAAGVPSAPSALSSSVSGTTATISFTAGANGGSALTNYQYSTDGGSTFTSFSPAVTSSPVTISGLTYGTTYFIMLNAVNSAGNSTSSSALSVAVPTVVPFEPTALSAGSITSNSAVISFSAGANGGSALTNYQYSTNGGTSFTSFSPATTSSPVTISGLSGGTTYSVVLRAVNANGNGASSSSVSVTTSNVAPSAPTALSSSEVGTTSAKISFTAGSNGGSSITNYKYSTNGGTSFTAFSPAVTASPVTITGLTSNTTYSVVIKAVNSVGDGSSSAALSVKTSTIPGSLLFGDTSRELALNPGVSMGAGAYTVECWFYNNSGWGTASPNFAGFLGHTVSQYTGQDAAGGLAIFFNNGNTVGTDRNGGDMRPTYTFTNAITINAWHHFVLVRNSDLIETVFIDGVKAVSCGGGNDPSDGQQTNVKDYNGNSVEIGRFYQGYWPGFLTNFRIVPGAAVYDPTASSITVPNAALTNIEGTKYLMVGDSITGDGSSTQTVTNIGGVTLSTTMVPL